MRRLRDSGGQSLVETAIALPLLLILLAGGYWGYRRLALEGAAMSAAQTHLLRAGRAQTDMAAVLAGSILPGGKGVAVSARNESLAGGVPPSATTALEAVPFDSRLPAFDLAQLPATRQMSPLR